MRPSRESRFLRIILALFFLLAAGYAAYEARGLLIGPKIHVAETSFSSKEAFISVKGETERITELRLNGTTISVTENGSFDEPYLLAAGSNRIILEAKDARGRTAIKTLDIIYLAPTESEEIEPSQVPSIVPTTTTSPTASSTASTSPEDDF